ncbi:MAG: hypothetical protein KC464_30010, partial [Myxococcales bacterium]|nr:hypothetical protein [Myxococcales bacterium]
ERADDAPAGGDAATDHELRPTGRWRHAPGYLRRLAAAHGFVVEAMTPAELRREHHDEVAGLIVVLRAA